MSVRKKRSITEYEILSAQTPRGGWKAKQLRAWGVPWPPPRGWKAKIIAHGIPYDGRLTTPGIRPDYKQIMIEKSHLLTLADAFIAATGKSEGAISSAALNESKKLARLRAGYGIDVDRFNAALVWFDRNWPEGLAWPEGVVRPPPGYRLPNETEEKSA